MPRLVAETESGVNVYAILRNSAGRVYENGAFVAWNNSNFLNYYITLTESGTSGFYSADLPSLPDGTYYITGYVREGGSPAINDTKVWSDVIIVGSPYTGADIILARAYAANSLDIYRGTSYKFSEGTQIPVARQANETWPSTISTVDFYASPRAATLARNSLAPSLDEISCTVVDDDNFYLELDDGDTEELELGANAYDFSFIANRATEPFVLRSGTMTVRSRVAISFAP